MKEKMLNNLITEYGFEVEATLHFALNMDKCNSKEELKALYNEAVAIGDTFED